MSEFEASPDVESVDESAVELGEYDVVEEADGVAVGQDVADDPEGDDFDGDDLDPAELESVLAEMAYVDGDEPFADEQTATAELPAEATAQGSLFAASTGDPRVDGAVARLADLATTDITDHPAVLEDVHRRLHDALADLDR